MEPKKYAIIFDTNKLRHRGDKRCFGHFQVPKSILDFLNMFHKNNKLSENVDLLLPKMVLAELRKQELDAYGKQISKLNEFKKNFSNTSFKLEYDEDFDYASSLDKDTKFSLDEFGIKLIEDPSPETILELKESAIKKEWPFYETQPNFKDAIIWGVIIEYSKKNPNKKIIVFSEDKHFKPLGNSPSNKIRVIKEIVDLKQFLCDELEINPDLLEIIKHLEDPKNFRSDILDKIKSSYDYKDTIDSLDLMNIEETENEKEYLAIYVLEICDGASLYHGEYDVDIDLTKAYALVFPVEIDKGKIIIKDFYDGAEEFYDYIHDWYESKYPPEMSPF